MQNVIKTVIHYRPCYTSQTKGFLRNLSIKMKVLRGNDRNVSREFMDWSGVRNSDPAGFHPFLAQNKYSNKENACTKY